MNSTPTHRSSGGFAPGHPWRFKPGQSGNPNGRPSSKHVSISGVLRERLAQASPRAPEKTYADVIADIILREALNGSHRALKMLLDRVEGRAPNSAGSGNIGPSGSEDPTGLLTSICAALEPFPEAQAAAINAIERHNPVSAVTDYGEDYGDDNYGHRDPDGHDGHDHQHDQHDQDDQVGRQLGDDDDDNHDNDDNDGDNLDEDADAESDDDDDDDRDDNAYPDNDAPDNDDDPDADDDDNDGRDNGADDRDDDTDPDNDDDADADDDDNDGRDNGADDRDDDTDPDDADAENDDDDYDDDADPDNDDGDDRDNAHDDDDDYDDDDRDDDYDDEDDDDRDHVDGS